jgi:hypothetical protein
MGTPRAGAGPAPGDPEVCPPARPTGQFHGATTACNDALCRDPGLMIDLPVWSTLMLEFEAFRLTIGHDREPCTPPLTSTEVSRSARLITRLPASEL